MTTVRFYHMNSGGRHRAVLTEDLSRGGFRVTDDRNGIVHEAEFDSVWGDPEMALDEARRAFTRATDLDHATVGCECCGPPFQFFV